MTQRKGKVREMADEVEEENLGHEEFHEPEMKPMTKREGIATVIEGSNLWNFKKMNLFIGRPTGIEKIVKDPDSDDPNATKVLGYVFEDEDGDKWLLGNSYAIKTTLETVIANPDGEEKRIIDHKPLLQFEWIGKKKLRNGKTANKFDVDILEW